jgi:hypothetical protein
MDSTSQADSTDMVMSPYLLKQLGTFNQLPSLPHKAQQQFALQRTQGNHLGSQTENAVMAQQIGPNLPVIHNTSSY